MKILVTGAGGFIGSHLAERLSALGHDVRAFVRYNSSSSWGWLDECGCKDEIEVISGDIRDMDSVRRAARGADAVFHLAALIGIPYSYVSPLAYVRTNVEGTYNVLEACRDLGVGRVVHTSTSEVYGTARYVPMDERHPVNPQSPYAASKSGADHLALSYHRSFETPVSVIRPFNTYGPRQSARAVIPAIISQLLAGGELRLGSLAPTRDLNFVSDTVKGFVEVGLREESVGRVTNIGTGREISIGDLAAEIAGIMGAGARIAEDPARIRPSGSEVERLRADVSFARSLGWAPEVSLPDGLRMTVDWIRRNRGAFRAGGYAV
ncbi:MAG: SDR family NAD(P)-dependent oxidoreductase [Synergistaceae bacterium]|jgi:dTDP-glucose 4,6-dehydratase|nr:SDR family NAD(P)-dependent oxidoreductase [Synergistaceae bacterium]